MASQAVSANEPLLEAARNHLHQALASQLQPGDRVEIEIRPLDSRLQLPACAFEPSFEQRQPITPGAFSLKAACAGPKRWSVYLTGQAEIYRPVAVSRLPLQRGATLSASAVALQTRPLSSLHQGYYTDPAAILDSRLRRNLPAGSVLAPPHLDPPLLVREGDQVSIQARAQRLTVETAGIALEDGRLNQQIRVKNSRSGRIIRARVAAKGRVQAH